MQPLNDLTVVTVEQAIAALLAARQLADLGAGVIKIERPGVGDFARGYDQRERGRDSDPALKPVPALGEHTDAILRKLGLDAAAIAALGAAEAI